MTIGLTSTVSNIDMDISNEENEEGSNIVVYGVMCMLEDVCKLEKFYVPFEVVRPSSIV